jgi:hypothetical protein
MRRLVKSAGLGLASRGAKRVVIVHGVGVSIAQGRSAWAGGMVAEMAGPRQSPVPVQSAVGDRRCGWCVRPSGVKRSVCHGL